MEWPAVGILCREAMEDCTDKGEFQVETRRKEEQERKRFPSDKRGRCLTLGWSGRGAKEQEMRKGLVDFIRT